MSVYQRSDGRWVHKWKDTTRPKGKQWVQETFGTREEAEEREDEKKQESRESSRLTVYEAVGLYLNDHNLSVSVESQYRWLVGGTSSPHAKKRVGYAECIADRYVDSLDRRDLNAVRDCCREGACANATVNMWIHRLQAVFRYCAREDLIPANPWERYAHSSLPEERVHRMGTLAQLHALWPHLPEWLQWAVKTAMALFLRPGMGELFRLKWAAFDWATGSVAVWMPKVKTMKTVYPVPEYMVEARERFRMDSEDGALYVCRSFRGKAVTNYAMAWGRACKKAGVFPFPMYALRHIVASEALRRGADIAAVAANLGHASPQTTLQTYAHALPAAQRDASARLGAVWCSPELPEPVNSGS